MKDGLYRLIALILLLCALIMLEAYLFTIDTLPVLILNGILIVICILRIIKTYANHTDKLRFLMRAVNHNDFSFRFNEKHRYNKRYNHYLNTIKESIEQTKSEIAEREKYYELIMSKVKSGVIVTNQNNSVIQTNDMALRILGIDRLLHLNNLSYISEGLDTGMKSIEPDSSKILSFQNEREVVNINVQLSVMESNGRIFKIYSITNISNELDEQEIAAWSKLTRVLTHEIMNGLTPIISISETIKDTHEMDAAQLKAGLETIHSTSKSLVRFVDNYRNLSRIPTPQRSAFYVDTLLKKCFALYESAKNVKISYRISPDDLLIYADESLIFQVISNLIKNGMDAIHGDDGKIEIRAYSTRNENVVIEVYDNGEMIPEDIANQIFIPFFTTKEEGNGIGLSLSKQIMQLHNGSLSFKQDDSGKRFIMTFR